LSQSRLLIFEFLKQQNSIPTRPTIDIESTKVPWSWVRSAESGAAKPRNEHVEPEVLPKANGSEPARTIVAEHAQHGQECQYIGNVSPEWTPKGNESIERNKKQWIKLT
jgi:hypothetical protein